MRGSQFEAFAAWRLGVVFVDIEKVACRIRFTRCVDFARRNVVWGLSIVPKPKALCTLSSAVTKMRQDMAPDASEMTSVEAGRDSFGRNPSGPGKIPKLNHDHAFSRPISNNGGVDEVLMEEDLYLEGSGLVTASLLRDCLTWHHSNENDENGGSSCCGRARKDNRLGQVFLTDVYGSEMCEMKAPSTGDSCCFSTPSLPQMHRFVVYSFQRSVTNKCDWIPSAYTFCHENADVCQAWVSQVRKLLDSEFHRPKNLLVLVNPYGGKGIGVQTWKSVVGLFERARVRTKVVQTERAMHAHDLIANASEEFLTEQDGIVVVGGDGLFNEVLNGLLMSRHEGHAAPKPERVAEILARAANTGKGFTPAANSQENTRSPPMDAKPDSSGQDVLSPLLGKPTYPAVDMSRTRTSDAEPATTGYNDGKQFESAVQQGSLSSALSRSHSHSSSPGDVELTSSQKVDKIVPAAITAQTSGIQNEERRFMFPVEAEGVMTRTTDGEGLPQLASIVRHNSLRKTNLELRIGIIPAGSTDTVAISTTGSRDPTTAALHILLGDRMPLDIIRITGWKKSPQSGDEPPRVRYAASFAGYGFYGDVMKESELARWMGPARYDVAGVKVFMKHKKYDAEVSFLEMPQSVSSNAAETPRRKIICRANCFVCAQGTDLNHLVNDADDHEVGPSHSLPMKPRWRTTRDSFHSIGAAVMSCRNDKAPEGIAAHAHLADGLLHLIFIKGCSRPNYLRQLITLTRRGADPFDFDFVEYYKTPVFTFTSHGEESVWNIDGELFPAHQLSGQCFRGLVNIFARGPED